jgi:ribosomal protein S18 acetylase RimI-like enzyme
MILTPNDIKKLFMQTDKLAKVEFEFCDFGNEYHCTMVAEMINLYMADPMGGGTALTKLQQLRLVDGLASHPSSFVLFATIEETVVGMATCFINFSTFNIKPYLNIHDLIVMKELRGIGVGTALLNRCIAIAKERNYCKITLEVRDDNEKAQSVYRKLGFDECEPIMHFWTKNL